MSELKWETDITGINPNKILLRGYAIDKLMGEIPFSSVIFLALKGELPTDPESKMMDAILVSSIDHGATPPSALAARTIASTGANMNAAIAGGILAISQFHGGAIEGCMEFLKTGVDKAHNETISLEEASRKIYDEYKIVKKRIPGFGHRIHTDDPRTRKLIGMAKELKIAGKHIKFAEITSKVIKENLGKDLPINVDGAIAAVSLEMGFPKEIANSFFAISRITGLVAHAFEEKNKMKVMRKIHPSDHKYTGNPEREL
ncbi:citryl-CoA lyase [candidate division KSB1 bacterium]